MTNTIESLYEPFEVTTIAGNTIVTVEGKNDGTALVCRNMLRKHRFQRSFDYVFEDTGGGDPTAATPSDLPIIKENTFEFGVRILQVDPAVVRTVEVNCTRGVVCANELVVGGRVVSKEFLASVNMTLRELTELEAKDPNLFNELLSHYYHIITKTTETGVEFTEVIYKN